ncbi:hypothetical protein Fmac_024716 [Flemingia macrophylla]|uniref:Uncharacterized protein n=1 Tax=Flemingia macrophylla TaxID=520843 RepID=A0ABD1LQ97_9FABA
MEKEKSKSKKSRYVIKVLSHVAPLPSIVTTHGRSPSPFVAPTQSPSLVVAAILSPVIAPTHSPLPVVPPTQSPSSVAAATHSPSPNVTLTQSPASITTTTPSPTATGTPQENFSSSSRSINGDDLDGEVEEPLPNDRPMIKLIGAGYEDFVTKFSQAMIEATSSIGESQHMDPIFEERIRSQSWTEAAGGKQKGRIYGTGDLARVYKGGDSSFTIKRKTSDSEQEEITHLRQRVAKYEEKIRHLEQEQKDFQSVVMQFLPIEARNAFQQNQQQRKQQNDKEDQERDQQQEDSPNYDDY